MKRITIAILLCCAAAAGQQPNEQAEATTFWIPRSLQQAMGVYQPGQPTRMFLCNTSTRPLLAKVEWRRVRTGEALEHEAFLRPGFCSTRIVQEDELPEDDQLRTSWQRVELSARMGAL